jgi:hypothetical protein
VNSPPANSNACGPTGFGDAAGVAPDRRHPITSSGFRANGFRVFVGTGAVVAIVLAVLRARSLDVSPESSEEASVSRAEAPPDLLAPGERRGDHGAVVAPGDGGPAARPGSPVPDAPPSLVGRVVLPDGRPAVGARVSARLTGSDPRLVGWSVTSDVSGRFAFDDLALPGEHVVHAVLTEGGEWFGSINARTGDHDVRLPLRSGVDDDTILVRVLGDDGAPVASAIGALRTANAHSHQRVTQGRVFFDVGRLERTAMADAYVLVLAPRGPTGSPLAFGDARLDGVRGGGIYEIRLPRESSISGRVVGPDGEGVAGARLGAVRVDDAYPFDREFCRYDVEGWKDDDVVRSGADGAFRIGGVGEGDHWVLIDPPPGFLRSTALRARSGASDVRFVLRSGVSAKIRVLRPDGGSMSGASVWAGQEVDVRDRSWPRWYRDDSRTTTADGTVVLPHLVPGTKRVLSVRPPEASDDVLDAVLVDWTPSDTTVRLERGMPLGGVVRDTAGDAVGRCSVLCREPDGTTWRSDADGDGHFRFTAMPPITVELTVEGAPPGSPGPVRLNTGRRDIVLTIAKADSPRKK